MIRCMIYSAGLGLKTRFSTTNWPGGRWRENLAGNSGNAPRGDLVLIPDPSTEVEVEFGDGSVAERFMIGDIHHMDGRPWDCCLRSYLRSAVQDLERETGLAA